MTPELEARATAAFAARFGRKPEGVAFAPGRVNLIGEHVDYNDGLVLPMPLREGTAVAWACTSSPDAEVHAADLAANDSFPLAAPARPDDVDWRSYVRGMASLAPHRPAHGIALAIAGDLPRGAGVSSSASLCIAIGRAFAAAAGASADPVALARAAQRTEHVFAGVACGIMDQMAVACGQPGHAMLLDCRDLATRQIPLPADWAVAIVASGVTRGLVDGEYNARRAQCEAAARKLAVASLRDADTAQLDDARLSIVERARARHVIEEIDRVRAAAHAIEAGRLEALGAILREGHASLRDLFEVSVPPVDALVVAADTLLEGAGGARMTGAGFGGSVVVVLPRDRLASFAQALARPVTLAY